MEEDAIKNSALVFAHRVAMGKIVIYIVPGLHTVPAVQVDATVTDESHVDAIA